MGRDSLISCLSRKQNSGSSARKREKGTRTNEKPFGFSKLEKQETDGLLDMIKPNSDKETTAENKDSNFQSFTSQALRFRQKGSFETLLASHLAVAIPSPPLVKVRLISEACYMIPEGKLDLDMNLVETIYLICLSLLNTPTRNDTVSISWGFPKQQRTTNGS